jgi:metal-responsive CopG/Arc/MetJ family transcriptional regulator
MHGGARCTAVAKTSKNPQQHEEPDDSVRFSVSLPKPLYHEVQVLAKREDRSLAFVVRKAVENYVREDQPLFHKGGQVQ